MPHQYKFALQIGETYDDGVSLFDDLLQLSDYLGNSEVDPGTPVRVFTVADAKVEFISQITGVKALK